MGRCIFQYKYLNMDQEYLPLIPESVQHIPSADETSSIKIDYFQSIGGPKEYANLVTGGFVVCNGITFATTSSII